MISEQANNKVLTNEEFCNLFQSCYFNNNSCINVEKSREDIERETLNSIYKEFDERYGDEEELIKENIDKLLLGSVNYLNQLKRIENYNRNKYDNLKNKIGDLLALDEDNKEIIKSPYEELRDIILGQSDFIKKQNDIQKFVIYFTRLPNDNEDQYWLYCNSSNTKLLPSFLKRLANVFLSNGDYLLEIDIICSEQGTISDDGNAWVDKYSGYFIKNIDYDTEEGFTEEGFKLKTREKLEQDLGEAVLEQINDPNNEKTLIKDKEEVQMISNIINALSNFMNIDLKSHNDFIINNTLRLYDKLVPQIKKQFTILQKKSLEKGTTLDISIKDNLDQNLLIITLSYFLIAIQISIPSINSRKTFPGCVKSFIGYPINGTDKSAIQYVACVTNKIKFNSRPWSSIRKLKESSIIKRMEAFIDSDILKQQVVIEKINEKIKDSLNNVGLLHKINENINNLSGGQLQRVLIARALAQNADILLLGEAFSAVDVGAQEDIMQLINSINLDGKTVLIATHDINNLEEKFDEVLCLNRHCCAFGDPSEVLTEEVIEEMYGSHNEMFKNHFKNNHRVTNDN